MLDNSALTIILVTLNVLWIFILTFAAIYTWLAYDLTQSLQKDRRELRKRLDKVPAPDPKTRWSYRAHMDDPADIVNQHDYPTR